MKPSNPQRGGALNPTQRMSVRLALATGATIVTLLGAQILALQDQSGTTSQQNTANIVEQPVNNTTNSNSGKSNTTNNTNTAISTPTATTSSVVINTSSSQPSPSTRSSRRG